MGVYHTDFTGVIERGDYESGDYSFEVKSVKDDVGKNGPYMRLGLQFQDGRYAGLMHEEIVSLAKGALWRTKPFLKACGYDVPDGPFSFDSAHLLGIKFKAHGEREIDPEGKFPPKLKLTQYFPKEHEFEITTPPAGSAAQAAASASPANEIAPPGSAAPATPTGAAQPPGPARPKLKV